MALARPLLAESTPPPHLREPHTLPSHTHTHMGPEASRNSAPDDGQIAQSLAGGSSSSSSPCSDSAPTQLYQFCHLQCSARQTRRVSGPADSSGLWKT